MKKIISFLLVLATLVSCCMLTVSAEETVVSDEARLPFEDVKANHWFYEAVGFCYANGIIKGMNEYTFGWNGNLTRAQFLLMLATIDGADLTQYQVTKFTDVKSNHWYYGAVAWAYEEGITNGMSETKFGPNNNVTRAQIARMMNIYMSSRYSVEITEDCLDGFADVAKIPDWAKDGVKYVVSAGLISGMEMDGRLCVNPNGTTTRAQAAVIFKSFVQMYLYGNCEHVFSLANCIAPAECLECGMINGLPAGHIVPAGYNCITGGVCEICKNEIAPSEILHDFADATCTDARKCTRCGDTRGEAKGHNFKAATCTAPKTCTVCKATEGSAKGHSWKAATCTAPKTCGVCNVTEGSALGHTTTTGTCGRCGKVFASSGYDSIVNLLKSTGRYVAEGNSYVLVTEDYDSATGIVYYMSEKYMTIECIRGYSNGHSDMTFITIDKYGTVYEYGYMYANTTEYLFAGSGLLDAATFNKNTKEGFSDYEGAIKSVYTDYMNSALKQMLNETNSILKPYGYSVKDLGFKAY